MARRRTGAARARAARARAEDGAAAPGPPETVLPPPAEADGEGEGSTGGQPVTALAVIPAAVPRPLEPPPPSSASYPARDSGVWSSIPAPIRVALALVLLPLTVYALILRSPRSAEFKTGAVMIWTALLLLPLVLTHLGGVMDHVSIPAPVRVPATGGEVAGGASRAPAPSPSASSRRSPSASASPGTTPAAPGVPAQATAAAVPPPPTGSPAQPVSSPTPTHASSTCGAPANPWGYTLCGGRLVTTPDPNFCTVFNCAPRFWTMKAGDYVAECTDGSYVPNGGRPNECAGHGTEAHRLYGP